LGYITFVSCEVEYSDDFEGWWTSLDESEQESVAVSVRLLEVKGVALRHPHSSEVKSSKHGHMRELRVQHGGEPYRVFYAFDPRRVAFLLIGGCKGGQDRFYEEFVPRADKIYDDHLEELRNENAKAAKHQKKR
jgi:hypothetical protein